MSQAQSLLSSAGAVITGEQIHDFVAGVCPAKEYTGRKVLVIVPDATRTAPVGPFFRALHRQIAGTAAAFDVMVALGTHQPMSEAFGSVQLLNHEWDNPAALRNLGSIPAEEISALSGGLFAMDVEVKINARIFEYDQVIIVGPVFPHEVVGFSGGNKYLFPGVAGPEILNFFHWLGAVITNPMIIGNKWTPVRKVVDRAAKLVTVDKL
jgi:nickel-dependent lactate racemase